MALCPSVVAFSGNYHEALAWCWWQMHSSDKTPTEKNGGVYFILASSAADIRGTSMGVKPLCSFPDVWNKINWQNFHTAKGAKEFMAKIAPAGEPKLILSDILGKAAPEILEREFASGKTLAGVAINSEQIWIARGWALHGLGDYIGSTYRISEKEGANGRFLPENVLLEATDPTDTPKYLDDLNDARSALWAGLPDVDPETYRRIADILSDPERGGRLLANFAFVLQSAYDHCGADTLGMKSSMERAQKVMLPVVNEFAHGIKVPFLGRNAAFGWGAEKEYYTREKYAREVALPELYGSSKGRATRGM